MVAANSVLNQLGCVTVNILRLIYAGRLSGIHWVYCDTHPGIVIGKENKSPSSSHHLLAIMCSICKLL